MRVNPYTLHSGDHVIFRCNGTGAPHVARVLPRGPVGQFRVQLVELGGVIGVNEHNELFVTH